MTRDRQAVGVWIGGEEHMIRSPADPEYTKACAELVDTRLTEVRALSGSIDANRAAILAALSIADELLQARADIERLRRDYAKGALDAAQRLDADLGAA
jgi:cell division protein ZapA